MDLEKKVEQYKKVLESIIKYADERKECHFYLETIADYAKTSLIDIEES